MQMKDRIDFAVFILTHGRANNQLTYKTLRSQGYTGRIILLVDDEDDQIEEYKKHFDDQVVVFCKQEAIEMTDSGDNFKKRNSVVFARNYNFVAAKKLGIRYFLQLDDDYTAFRYTFDNYRNYITKQIRINNLDVVIGSMLKFYIASGAKTIAMTQGGDFIGGEGSKVAKLHKEGKYSRKVMNSFFCDSEKPFKFCGRLNEDVSLYTEKGYQGCLMITVPRIRLEQKETQKDSGGNQDVYKDLGTYVKSFYSIMYSPSCVFITMMGVTNKRIHHQVKWKNACPMVLSESVKK
jgi:hypothetical protein|tara:strand:+ start:518 stop:1393 length:876 start_codon:yes stop_codon:yes gene_type:complete